MGHAASTQHASASHNSNQYSSGSTRTSHPPPNTRTSASSTSSAFCSSCGVKFNAILRRSNVCSCCREHYCKLCCEKESKNVICRRCAIFVVQSKLEWDTLMKLGVKDLKWFLRRNHIAAEGYTEKEQMVEVILDVYGSESYQRSKESQTRRVCQMKVQMDDLRGEEGGQRLVVDAGGEIRGPVSPNSQELSPQYPTVENVSECPEASGSDTTRVDPPVASSHVESGLEHCRSEPVIPNVTEVPPPAHENPTIPSVPHHSATDPSLAPSSAIYGGSPQRVRLEDLENEEALERLSVRQLKDLLASNFVDYKGCLERHELCRRAARLYQSHVEERRLAEEQNRLFQEAVAQRKELEKKKQQATAGGGGGGPSTKQPVTSSLALLEENTCRVCMDSLINCVFLECGHSVTCVTCGKQMAECPICRQHVVRVVHIFRS